AWAGDTMSYIAAPYIDPNTGDYKQYPYSTARGFVEDATLGLVWPSFNWTNNGQPLNWAMHQWTDVFSAGDVRWAVGGWDRPWARGSWRDLDFQRSSWRADDLQRSSGRTDDMQRSSWRASSWRLGSWREFGFR